MDDDTFPRVIRSRDGSIEGTVTGSTRRCGLEGCRGEQYLAVWPDGKYTWPCSKGIREDADGTWRIG